MEKVRFVAACIGFTVLAIFGTAVIDSQIIRLVHVHTLPALLVVHVLEDLAVSMVLGILAFLLWGSAAGGWIWVLPAIAILLKGTQLVATESFSEALQHLGGMGCMVTGTPAAGSCHDFIVLTIPFIRCMGFSTGFTLSALAKRIISPRELPSKAGSR